ncbi:MAG: energy-coupling factor ABC transporter permease [Casimicrobium sp.]
MNLYAENLSLASLVACWLLMLLTLPLAWLYAAKYGDWARLASRSLTHVWHASIALIVATWSLKSTLGGGFTFHLLAMTGVTLALGVPLALLSAALATVVFIMIHSGSFANVAAIWVTLALVPIATTRLVLWASQQWLPPNFFVYIFVVAFGGAALSRFLALLASLCLWSLGDGRLLNRVLSDYLPYGIHLAFAEALLTGMIVTIAVVYKPQWISTFDDKRYLRP